MATGSITDLVNRALLSIGARTLVSNISEQTTAANAAAILYTPTFESLARSANWNCLRTQASLTLLQAAPGTPENPNGTTLPYAPQPWLYAYEYPGDCLQIRYIMPNYNITVSTSVTVPPPSTSSIPSPVCVPTDSIGFPFVVSYGKDANGNPTTLVLTNVENAIAVYTVNQPNPQIWDSEFQSAFVALLGAALVPALAMNMALMDRQVKLAEGYIARARIRDGDEGFTKQDHTPDWFRARSGGSGTYLDSGIPYQIGSTAYGQEP